MITAVTSRKQVREGACQQTRELTEDELAHVSGGAHKHSSGGQQPITYLKFDFKMVI
jgi:bacteriocin-like protein